MAITVVQAWKWLNFSTGKDGQAEMAFVVRGTDDPAVINSKIIELADGMVVAEGFPYIRHKIEDAEYLAPLAWMVRVTYVRPSAAGQEQPGQSRRSFRTTGGTTLVTFSKQTVGSYMANDLSAGVEEPPNHKGAIGVTDDSVEGCDIVIPVFEFQETKIFDDAQVTNAFKGVLFRKTGTMNDAAFYGMESGECLFLGVEGEQQDDATWEITFNFAGSPNATNIAIGDNLTVAAKLGWDYLWVQYAPFDDANAKGIARRPIFAYVERVYDFADFSTLQIGT